jgi:hypothetical protein
MTEEQERALLVLLHPENIEQTFREFEEWQRRKSGEGSKP